MDYQIIDTVEASVYWKDLNGKYQGCNQFMANMAGVSREKIIGKTDYELPWKQQANQIQAIDSIVINHKIKYEVEERALIHGGAIGVYFSTKSPLFDNDNNVTGVIGVSIDITEDSYFMQKFTYKKTKPLDSILIMSEALKSNLHGCNGQAQYKNIGILFTELNKLYNFILNTYYTELPRKINQRDD